MDNFEESVFAIHMKEVEKERIASSVPPVFHTSTAIRFKLVCDLSARELGDLTEMIRLDTANVHRPDTIFVSSDLLSWYEAIKKQLPLSILKMVWIRDDMPEEHKNSVIIFDSRYRASIYPYSALIIKLDR